MLREVLGIPKLLALWISLCELILIFVYHKYSSASYQCFKNRVKTLTKWFSTGKEKINSVFPDKRKIFGLLFTEKCSFVFQKNFSHPKKGNHMLKHRFEVKTDWKFVISHLEELFPLDYRKDKQEKQGEDISATFFFALYKQIKNESTNLQLLANNTVVQF